MIAEISAAISTSKTILEALKTLNEVSKDEQVRSAVFELRSQLLSLQEKMFDANAQYEEKVEEIKALKKELDSKSAWDEEKNKYEMFQPADGMTVYRLKTEHNTCGGEIWVCPNCFSEHKVSFLNKRGVGDNALRCHACEFWILPKRMDEPTARRRPGTGWMKPY